MTSDVATTAAYPTSGTLAVATSTTTGIITYTGTSGGNSFTGCAYVSGSATGTVSTGGAVSLDSLTAISSSNVNTGSFTAPPSGSVVVTASFVGQIGTGSVGYGFGLLGHGTSTLYGSMIVDSDSTTGIRRAKTLPFLVTGLTAGTSYNFDLGIVTSAGDVYTIYAFAPTAASNPNLGSGGQGAPVVMTVQAV